MVRSVESLSSVIPLGTSTKRANSKRANHGRSHLFKMPFRPCPSDCGRFLSADDGHDRCLQCLGFQHAEDAFVDDSCACCGPYEHDFVAISPFLYERIGTLCRHPCRSLCKQRIAGWRSGRSEGDSKSLSSQDSTISALSQFLPVCWVSNGREELAGVTLAVGGIQAPFFSPSSVCRTVNPGGILQAPPAVRLGGAVWRQAQYWC